MRRWGLFALGWALILMGSLLAHLIQTSGGVRIEDVRYPGEDGKTMSGLLYVPRNATAGAPAPAVLASHGYINTREMQSAFAIELARRGVVVLAMEMTGHGYSQAAVGQQGFGGPAALRYLQGLPFVDRANIGLEGHSMGGIPIQAAAQAQPDGYRAMVLEGSTTGFLGAAPPGTPDFPRNTAVVFGRYDEFAPLMWEVAKGGDIGRSPKLMALFGTTSPVAPERLYGSIAEGTARRLHLPPVTHPWEHFSVGGVAPAVAWFQATLDRVDSRPPGDQIWIWKEVGTGLAFIGFVILLLGTFQLLLTLPPFARLAAPGVAARERRDGRWWLAFVLTAAVPALTFFPFMKLGGVFFPMRFFPQYIGNQLVVWALLNGIVTLLLGLLLRGPKPAFRQPWLGAIGLALATAAIGYGALALVDAAFKVDFRFWVLGLKPLDARHAGFALAYLVPWAAFFLIAVRALIANLAVKDEPAWAQYLTAALAMSLGFVALLALQYAWLFATGVRLIAAEPLNTLIAIQFVPLLMVVGLIAAFTWRRTASALPGAFLCALLICWYVTAGTATHWSPEFRLPERPAAKT
ncbi:MAG: alpha/beta hydrolase [Caulobacteraceae bacterium]|nr:alpha/beta hydrolase [Caulobacteraceae bacterium]